MKRSCDFMGENPSRQVSILQSLVIIATLVAVTWSLRITWSIGHVTLWVRTPHVKSPHCQVLLPLCKWGYIFSDWKARFHMSKIRSSFIKVSKAHGTPYSHTKIQHIKTVICWCMQWRISDLGHRCLKEQLTELNKTFFASLSKNSVRKKDKKKMAMAKLFALHANPQKRQLQSALCYTQIQKESKKVCCKVFWFTSKRKKRNEILLETLKRVYNILPETKQLIDQNLTGIFAKENFSVEKAFFLFWF